MTATIRIYCRWLKTQTRFDIDMYVFTPVVYLSKDIKINPYYVFVHSQNGVWFFNQFTRFCLWLQRSYG